MLRVPVSVLQEGLLENVETFSCILSAALGETGVIISRGRASVSIIDSDGECMHTQMSYAVL